MTIVLLVLVTFMLVSLLGGDFFARMAHFRIYHHLLAAGFAIIFRIISWICAAMLLSLFFAVIYYFAPDLKTTHWHWLTPGAAVGILGWFVASVGLRIYVHLFGNYSLTYGSLGAVIILLTWFYLSGLMLLLGAEINSEIEAAAAARRLLETEQISVAEAAASVGGRFVRHVSRAWIIRWWMSKSDSAIHPAGNPPIRSSIDPKSRQPKVGSAIWLPVSGSLPGGRGRRRLVPVAG